MENIANIRFSYFDILCQNEQMLLTRILPEYFNRAETVVYSIKEQWGKSHHIK